MPVDVDQLILEIAARFKEHGMTKHLEQLRAYYRDRRQRRRRARASSGTKAGEPWPEDMIIEWAALWRIPPFENVYPVLMRGSLCPCSSGALRSRAATGADVAGMAGHDAKSFIEITFPEGHLMCCGACRTRWLVIEAAARE